MLLVPVDLVIGPHIGVSYITHPQAKPTRVTDFQNIERITTTALAVSKDNQPAINSDSNGSAHLKASKNGSASNSPILSKKSDKRNQTTCSCNEIKTQLKIKVKNNVEDLAITCNGVKTAESIADLVDGYCRLFNNSDFSLWERSCKLLILFILMSDNNFLIKSVTHPTPSNSATNSLEKPKQKEDSSVTTSTSEPSKAETNSTTTNDNALPPPTLSKKILILRFKNIVVFTLIIR